MRIEKCWYCSCNVYPGHGTMFVRNDCKTFRFCSGKCHAHFKMRHNPKKLKWTKASRKYRGKEMVLDKTFEFEKRRNEPVRYDRNLWIKTIQAMKRIQQIRQVRKVRFHKKRLANLVKKRETQAEKELKKHAEIVSVFGKELARNATLKAKGAEKKKLKLKLGPKTEKKQELEKMEVCTTTAA
ncbi:unnamed protein product [Amoebophrya sp. A120]|nr:unnamed protein product [Amoebophrya sp. A120]|eukprot:GSA120T00021819001.1